MTIEKSGLGWKIRSESKGTLYPKLYATLAAAKKRLKQLEMFKSLKASGKLRNG